MMPTQTISALILAEPGPIQEGLWELVSALPEVRLIGSVADEDEAVRIVKKMHPMLVILQSHFRREDGQSVIREMKSTHPGVICIVMASDVEQKRLAREAGADSVQMTGYPAEDLYRSIQLILGLRGAVSKGVA